MMARLGASRRGVVAWAGSPWGPASADSSASGMSHLSSVAAPGGSPDLQNCVIFSPSQAEFVTFQSQSCGNAC